MALDFSQQAEDYTPQQALRDSAQRLGVQPEDWAKVISYETGGSFDPWQKGPTTKWGEHRGLIQWGEPQRQEYGVTPDMSFQEQLFAAEKYLQDRGFQPGQMGVADLYSTINAGSPGRYEASDRPGFTVARHVQELEAHAPRAQEFLQEAQLQGDSKLDFSSQAEPVAPQEPVGEGPSAEASGRLDFSSQAEPVSDLDASATTAPAPEAGTSGGVTPPGAVDEQQEPGVFDFARRSLLQYQTRNTMLRTLSGELPLPEASKRFAELVKMQEAIPERQSYAEGAKAWAARKAGKAPQYDGVTGVVRFFYDHPAFALEAIGESSVQTLEGLGLGAAAAIPGSALGPLGTATGFSAGLGASSGLTEGISKYMEVLAEEGVDVTSEESLKGAFANPELLAKARDKAVKKGITVAGFDVLTAFIGIRGGGKVIANSISKTVSKDVVEKTAAREAIEEGAASLLFLEAPGGMAGEAFGELAAGDEVDGIAVGLEGLGEVTLSAPQVAIQTAVARQNRVENTPQVTAEDIAEAYGNVTQTVPFEKAQQQGRNWFGFIDEKDNSVVRDYAIAEQRMGKKDPRTGRLVAASAEDVTAHSTDAVERLRRNEAVEPRFVNKDTEQEARRLWQEFVTAERENKPKASQLYDEAVSLGARVEPLSDEAIFVGDAQTLEILPKSEIPLRQDMFTATATTATGQSNITPGFSLNMQSLLEDGAFVVSPRSSAIKKLASRPNAPELAAALFEPVSEEMQNRLVADGWKPVLEEMQKSAQLEQFFQNGDLRMRPAAVWASRMFGGMPQIQINTKLRPQDARAALEQHAAIMPTPAIEGGPAGVDIADQAPNLASPIITGDWDVKVKNPSTAFVDIVASPNSSQETLDSIKGFADVAERVMKGLGIKEQLIVVASDSASMPLLKDDFTGKNWEYLQDTTRGSNGFMIPTVTGDVLLFIPPHNLVTTYRVFAHEFGHALSYWMMAKLPATAQAQIYAAYRRYMLTYRSGTRGERAHQVARSMGPRLSLMLGAESAQGNAENYYLSFEEWFAEQTSRWATTSFKPMSRTARFFRALGKTIIRAVRDMQKLVPGMNPKAEPIIQEWLNSAYDGTRPPWAHQIEAMLREKTKLANSKHGIPVPLQAESIRTQNVVSAYGDSDGTPPPNTPPENAGDHSPEAQRAQNDRFNWLLKWGINFRQLAQLNPRVRPLQLYAELMERLQLTQNNIMAEAETQLRAWRKLRRVKTGGRSQADRLADFLFDMTEMKYLSPSEARRGDRRNPTQAEFDRLVKKHQLNAEALQLYTNIKSSFEAVILRQEELAIEEANRTFANNPDQLRIAIGRAELMTRRMLAAPYFPMKRFGKWAVTIRTSSGGIEHFETFETKKQQQLAFKEAARRYPEGDGWGVVASTLPEEMQTFVGMPPWMMDKLEQQIVNNPTLSEGQRNSVLENFRLLRYETAPATSFSKHLLPRKRTPGYSRDAERVYAKYMFHHARNFARIKYQPELDTQVRVMRSAFVPGEAGAIDVNKRTQIADFLQNHLNEVTNPMPDWHFMRSLTSVWFLGAVPASAALNMTQTVLMTAPYLGSKFSDSKAMATMTKVAGQMSTYYKRGKFEGQTDSELRMLDFLIKQGLVTESMAAELAGLAAGNALDSYLGFSDKAHRSWLAFADKAMFMFKTVEQWNRRVTARAAYRLALAEPNNGWVQELKNRHYLQYQDLLGQGLFNSESEVLAVLAAKEAILNTQYDYSREARPRFMRGRKGLIFAFYMFTQNTVFQLANPENKGLFIRYALVMTLLAGPMGLLPDDAEDILNFIARRFFGGDFDLKLEARKLVNQLTGDPDWTDGILHGAGRHGMGVPALMKFAGAPYAPEVDFSRLIDLRHIAPLPVTKMLDAYDRGTDAEKQLSRFTQDLAGAGFGLPFAWYKAITESELDGGDIKRWEGALPRALKQAVRAWRIGYEGGERVGRSNYIMEFDKNDPQDVAELIGIGAGFTPTRMAQQWDLSMAQREVAMFWDIKRKTLLARAFDAKFYYGDKETWDSARKAILRFNKEVPDAKLKITPDTLKKSFLTRRRRQQEFKTGPGPSVPKRLGRDIQQQFPDIKRISERPLPN